MIPIDERKRPDWNAIRAEYIGGGISQRKLAQKYGISVDVLLKRANREHWTDDRNAASNKAAIKAQQKTAEAAADVATVAARVKKRLLLRLERTESAFPTDATEAQLTKDGKRVIYRLRDLTAAYKDLTGDMDTGAQTNELLQSLIDLERGRP